jgi:hypothetical protein
MSPVKSPQKQPSPIKKEEVRELGLLEADESEDYVEIQNPDEL